MENVHVHVVFWISFKISFLISGSVFVPERHVLVQTPTFSVFTKTHTLSRLSKTFDNLLYVCHGFYYHWVEKHQPPRGINSDRRKVSIQTYRQLGIPSTHYPTNLTTPGIGMMHSFQDEHTQYVVYYEAIKRELKRRPIHECRCDEPETKTHHVTIWRLFIIKR